MQIRDTRQKGMFQVDDEYLNGYARLCGSAATCVYISLCRHVNKTQQAWPSIDLITQELAFSKSTVIRAIKTLEQWGIILVEREKDKKTMRQSVNLYVLSDKKTWKKKPASRVSPEKPEPGVKSVPSRVSPRYSEPGVTTVLEGYTQRGEGNTGGKVCETDVSRIDKNDISTQPKQTNHATRIIEVFAKTNPSLSYGNITQRKSAERIVDQYGIEKALKIAQYALRVQTDQYAPVITTPLELEKKVKLLEIFSKRNNKSSVAVYQTMV